LTGCNQRVRIGHNSQEGLLVIRFTCPRCNTALSHETPLEVVSCPKCNLPIRVPAPAAIPLGPPVELADWRAAPPAVRKAASPPEAEPPPRSVDEKFCHECGAVIRQKAEICPHCGVRQPIDDNQQAAPLERCYDCGQLIPEGRVFRRTVAVSSSYTSGSISATTSPGRAFGERYRGNDYTSGSYGGSTSNYAKVSLCPHCNWKREEAERQAERLLLIGFVLIVVSLLIVAALGGFVSTAKRVDDQPANVASPELPKKSAADAAAADGVPAKKVGAAADEPKRKSERELEIENLGKLVAELAQAPPPRQNQIIEELRDGKGIAYTLALANAIPNLDDDAKVSARKALAARLARLTPATLREKLYDPKPEVRCAAALVCGMKDDKTHVARLIQLLTDREQEVGTAAREALKALSGEDFGPAPGAGLAERSKAVADWKAWWKSQGTK
jgi:hypothetical protein